MAVIDDQMNALTFELPTTLTIGQVIAVVDSAIPAATKAMVTLRRRDASQTQVLITAHNLGMLESGRAVLSLSDGELRTVRFEVLSYLTSQSTAVGFIPIGPKSAPAWSAFRDLSALLRTALKSHQSPPEWRVPGDEGASYAAVPVAEPAALEAEPEPGPEPAPEAKPEGEQTHAGSAGLATRGRTAPPGMRWSAKDEGAIAIGRLLSGVGLAACLIILGWFRVGVYVSRIPLMLVILAFGVLFAYLGGRIIKSGQPRLVRADSPEGSGRREDGERRPSGAFATTSDLGEKAVAALAAGRTQVSRLREEAGPMVERVRERSADALQQVKEASGGAIAAVKGESALSAGVQHG